MTKPAFHASRPVKLCPTCGAPFEQFLPMQVCKSGFIEDVRVMFGKPIAWAVICRACKEIVGYETCDEAIARYQAECDAALAALAPPSAPSGGGP